MASETEFTPIASTTLTESPYEESSTRIGSESNIHDVAPHSEPESFLPEHSDTISPLPERPSMPLSKALTDRPKRQRRPSLFKHVRGHSTEPKRANDHDSSTSSNSSESEDEQGKLYWHGDETNRPSRSNSRTHAPKARVLGAAREIADPMASFSLQNKYYSSKAKVKNGRLEFSVKALGDTDYLQNAIDSTIAGRLRTKKAGDYTPAASPQLHGEEGIPLRASKPSENIPKLNIVVMVIGSRGDVQPFLEIGKVLKSHGHRVRLATHPAFKEFVEQDSQLEFFSVGGDPAELMAFMVKNPGLVPSMASVKAGDVGRRRESMYEMMEGFFRACVNVSDDEDDAATRKMMKEHHPFVADAIIANPPSFAHIHCAERLGIPLHIMFTMPYTATQSYPHPLSRINSKNSNVDKGLMNWCSYSYVELMTWQGLGDLVNRFRTKVLGLEAMSTLWAPGQLFRLNVPYTYMWSPALAPKPPDWGPEINVTGYVFLDLASSYTPPDSLTEFLESGEKPVYIGFGSITIDDPDKFTSLIFEAVEKAGVRALVSKGWGGLGADDTPKNIYMLDNCPHDWLFPRVSAVVHHGGAGTTAIGLKCGIPTMIVHFFGDQSFWGSVVAKAGAGASKTIPWKKLTAEKLAEGIEECLSVQAQKAAKNLATSIADEGDGAVNAVNSFHSSLPLSTKEKQCMRCDKYPERVAVWTTKSKRNPQRLSAFAVRELLHASQVRKEDLRLIHHMDWADFQGPGEPFTGGAAAIAYSTGSVVKGIASIPARFQKTVKQDRSSEKHTRTKKRPRTTRSILKAVPISTTRGLAKSTSVVFKFPLDFSLAVTLGFHNAPRLYGDTTVPPPPALHLIHGYKSGCRASGQELWYGFRDGYSGLVRLPILGVKEGRNPVLGGLEGFGKGVGGFVLKPIAGVLGVPTFFGMGIRREIQRFCTQDSGETEQWIREARILQGEIDWSVYEEKKRREDEMERRQKREGTAPMKEEAHEQQKEKESRAKANGQTAKQAGPGPGIEQSVSVKTEEHEEGKNASE